MSGKHGGFRPGAGRKTKAETLGLAKVLEDCISKEEENQMWAVVKREALKGNIQHLQLYFNYKYGKPTEHTISENDGETIITILRGTDYTLEEVTSSTETDTQGG